jgi:hypothetical protein
MQRRLKLTGLAALLAVGIVSAPLFAAGTGSAPANGPTTSGRSMMGGSGSSMTGMMAGTSRPRQAMTGHGMGGGMMGMMGMMQRMNQMMATGNKMMQRMIAYIPPVRSAAPVGGAARSK